MKQRFLRTFWLRGGDSNCYPLLQFLFSTGSALSSNGRAIVKSDSWFLQAPCPHFSPPPLSQAVKVGVLGCLHSSIRSLESPPGQLEHQGGQGRPPGGQGRGGWKRSRDDLPLRLSPPSVNSARPSPGRLSLTLGVTACLDVPGPSSSRLCSPGLMKGLLKPHLPDKMTGPSFRVMDGTQR